MHPFSPINEQQVKIRGKIATTRTSTILFKAINTAEN